MLLGELGSLAVEFSVSFFFGVPLVPFILTSDEGDIPATSIEFSLLLFYFLQHLRLGTRAAVCNFFSFFSVLDFTLRALSARLFPRFC